MEFKDRHDHLNDHGTRLEIIYTVPPRTCGRPLDLKPGVGAGRTRLAGQRHGEWLFVPAPALDERPDLVFHRDEPLVRGPGEPCVAEMLHRVVRKSVRVSSSAVFVRGQVTHPDRAPIWLESWHRVVRGGR